VTGDEKRALLAEIRQLTAPPAICPGDVTLAEVAAELGLSRAGARHRMNHLVEQGLVDTALVVDPQSNRQVRVYRRRAE